MELRGNWESVPGISHLQVNVDAFGRRLVAPLETPADDELGALSSH